MNPLFRITIIDLEHLECFGEENLVLESVLPDEMKCLKFQKKRQ